MKRLLKGNYAVAQGVKLSRVKVISAYPITPQTTIVEELSRMCSSGQLDSEFIKVESEHSAMAALVGSASGGVRSFTATSSHGLLLMHEVLHWAAGSRLPIVLANVNRAVGPGWNIWADQTDSVSQRDTGWIQFYCESNQEVLDSVIMAYRLAENVLLPVMLSYDAFFLSHTLEIVDVPDQERVDEFLPAYHPKYFLDVGNPRMFGGIIGPECYYEERYVMHRDALRVLECFREIGDEYNSLFGRKYDTVEEYRCDDASVVVVTAGTISSVCRIAIDKMREGGNRVGLLKIRMLRPVPSDRWQSVLGSKRKVVVIDRNIIPGSGGVFGSEIGAVLSALERRPTIYPVIAGIGGRDVSAGDIEGIIEYAMRNDRPTSFPLFWGLKE